MNTETLKLNDGWTQIPPKEDGEYWMACGKPWRSETAYDLGLALLVKIKDGKRLGQMEYGDSQWITPDCEDRTDPVWDSVSQGEMLAAWRPRHEGESFLNPPPEIQGTIFERHPAKCPRCGRQAAVYRMEGKNPWLCYSCGATGEIDKDYFDRQFVAALRKALDEADAS